MNDLTAKVREVEQDIAEEKGSLNLFALFEREDLWDRWDLVVAAPWAKHDHATLGYLADAIRHRLVPAEMTRLARIVVLDADEDPVLTLNEAFDVEHGQVELHHGQSFGLPISHGYIITSRRAA